MSMAQPASTTSTDKPAAGASVAKMVISSRSEAGATVISVSGIADELGLMCLVDAIDSVSLDEPVVLDLGRAAMADDAVAGLVARWVEAGTAGRGVLVACNAGGLGQRQDVTQQRRLADRAGLAGAGNGSVAKRR